MSRKEGDVKGRSGAMSPRTPDEDLASALPPRRGGREARVGLFVLIGVVSTLVALFTLTDAATFRGRYVVTTMVDDAGGLRNGDPVQMRGVNIGRVQRFAIRPDGVAIRLELEREYPVPADSRVALRSSGLLGGLTVEIIPGRSSGKLSQGDILTGTSGRSDIFGQASEMGQRADTVLTRVREILTERTVSNVNTSLEELRILIGELAVLAAEQRRELSALSGSLRRTAGRLEQATGGQELQRIVARTDTLTIRLAETTLVLGRASGALDVVLARIERGEGTLGRLSKDDSLYINLNLAAQNINRLAEDFQKNPRKYINLEIF